MGEIKMDWPNKTLIDEFNMAKWTRNWKQVYNIINAFPMYDMLPALDSAGILFLNEMRWHMNEFNVYGGPNMPKINFAMDIVQFRKLPITVPSDVQSSRDLQDAKDFLTAGWTPPPLKIPGFLLPVQMQPVHINRFSAEQHLIMHDQRTLMTRHFREAWIRFCNEWNSATIAAIATIPPPHDPYEDYNLQVAFATNILWAVTAILVPEILVGTMAKWLLTLAGPATIALTKSYSYTKTVSRSGRDLIRTKINETTDELEKKTNNDIFFQSIISLYFEEAIKDNLLDIRYLSDVLKQDRFLWRHFASDILYEDRRTIMGNRAEKQMKRCLEQFQQQFVAWKERDDVNAKAHSQWEIQKVIDRIEKNEFFSIQGGSLGDAVINSFRTPPDSCYAVVQDEIPFSPRFNLNE